MLFCLFSNPIVYSGTLEDLSDFAPGSVASPCVAQAAVVQLPSGVVSSAHCPSPPRRISPHARELHAPVLHNVHASRLDLFRHGYRGQGFLAHSVRLSSYLVCDREWDAFCTWCTERQIVPVSIAFWAFWVMPGFPFMNLLI